MTSLAINSYPGAPAGGGACALRVLQFMLQRWRWAVGAGIAEPGRGRRTAPPAPPPPPGKASGRARRPRTASSPPPALSDTARSRRHGLRPRPAPGKRRSAAAARAVLGVERRARPCAITALCCHGLPARALSRSVDTAACHSTEINVSRTPAASKHSSLWGWWARPILLPCLKMQLNSMCLGILICKSRALSS